MIANPQPRHVFLLVASIAFACEGSRDDVEKGSEPSARVVTYYDDVLPVLAVRCLSCHSDGGIGAFSMESYDEAKPWAAAMATNARERTMPPYSIDASGSCNTFADAQWLSEDEIAVIEAWVEHGMEMGDENAERTPVPAPNTLQNPGTIVTLAGPIDYTPVRPSGPGSKNEDYQCFKADYVADKDRFLTGFDVLPGNVTTVHHVIVMEVDPRFGGNGARIDALDADSPQQGWDCFGAAGEGVLPDGVPIVWAPGLGAVNYPQGTGIRIEQGNLLVIQVHYDLAQDDGPDSTQIAVSMADSVEREGRQALQDPLLFSSLGGTADTVAAGQSQAEYVWQMSLRDALFDSGQDVDALVDVWGVFPHMHTRGLSLKVDFEVDGEPQCGAHADRWDFNWQRMYFFEEPTTMAYGDTVTVTCTYDTSGDGEPVAGGFGSTQEMCLLGLYVTPR